MKLRKNLPIPVTIRPYLMSLRNQGEKFIWNGRFPGTVVNPSTFRSAYNRTIAAIDGVRNLSPHCCRHTYISQLQASGVDAETIRVLAGHADIDMTAHYMHIQSETKKAAVQKLDSVFKVS